MAHGLLAVAMGGQNAIARRLAVPDLTTTTVLTSTITGLVADATSSSVRVRRTVPIVAMLGGALVGGVMLRWPPGQSGSLGGFIIVTCRGSLSGQGRARTSVGGGFRWVG